MIGRGRGTSGGAIARVILLGIIAGIGYIVFDQQRGIPEGGSSLAATAIVSRPTASLLPSFTPEPTPVLPVRPTVRLIIPRLSVETNIVPVYLDDEIGSWNIRFLGGSAGHLEGTAWIDAPGNIVLAGHVERSDGSPGIFASLHRLLYGDEITLDINGEQRYYAVSALITTSPQDLSVLYPTRGDQLTLITCEAYDFISNTYQERIVVTALRIG